ncbi:MAG: hypothetical protein D8M58_01360 [Calditrichaeota bacterium]|nr:MAG: hypothetical protein DWQ03_05720 [Calditrichota bacterium]MBL1204017.1 hypothetical protein [Calditrichota bacterium]NOG43848.1 flagellar biosynthetic protein FliO [Calditrichota bacterium]
MRIVLIIFLLSLAPVIGQEQVKQSGQDSLFLSDGKKLTFSDSLRNAVPKEQTNVSSYLYQVVLVTFFLVLFLIGGLFLYKKFILKNNTPYSSSIKVIARQALSAKQSVVIVVIEGKKYALGVTEQQISLISDLGEVNDQDINSIENQPIGFGQILKKITSKE